LLLLLLVDKTCLLGMRHPMRPCRQTYRRCIADQRRSRPELTIARKVHRRGPYSFQLLRLT
jgi:hypothetical protein